MASFFPHVTGAFKLEEPHALRRFTMSPIAMGLVTGIGVRLYRALTLSVGPNESLLYVGAAFVLGQLFLLAMITLHLGNFTLRRWLYLVPVFLACEVVAEVLVSAGLIAARLERFGSVPATFGDWTIMSRNTLLWRSITIVLYAAILAGCVQLVRYILLRRGHREHTLEAVTETRAKH